MTKPLKSIVAACLAALALVLIERNESNASPTTSPSPDMPAEWFLHENDAMADPQRPLVGKPAPEIKLAKWFQNQVDLSPAGTKGKVVILDLWATWCVPCKIDMPKTDELAKQYQGKPVVFASICSDGEQDEVTQFINEKHLSLPMAWDDNAATFNAFAGQFMPTYVAIDKKGIVRAIGFKHDAMEKIIEKLLAE